MAWASSNSLSAGDTLEDVVDSEPMRILSGTVTDINTNAPLNATVTAVGQDGSFSDTTDSSGDYEIALPAGRYAITTNADEYYSQKLASFAVLTGAVKSLDFALEPLIPPPPYDFDLQALPIRFGESAKHVVHTATVANTGSQNDVYELSLGPSTWTTTLPFTRSAALEPQQEITIPVSVIIPPGSKKGDSDGVTLTVSSVYSPVHMAQFVLRTAIGYKVHLPLVLRNPQADDPSEVCEEMISNGGFEDEGSWEIPGTAYPASYATAAAHSGDRSMRVGIVEPDDNIYSYSSARQTVTIPTDTVSATLSFWLYPMTEETPASPSSPTQPPNVAMLSDDMQYVLVLDEDNQWIDTVIWQRTDDREWTFQEFDMGGYTGQTIKLQFGAYNDGVEGITAMYVDDVSLRVCRPSY